MVNQSLRNFLSSREGDIKAQIAALQDELEEILIARSAIDSAETPIGNTRSSAKMTQKDMILAVLDSRPEGGTSDKVIEWILQDFGITISTSSASTQLSRLKNDDKALFLDQKSKAWRSKKHAQLGDLLAEVTSPSNTVFDRDALMQKENAEDAATSPASFPKPSPAGA